jgi:hypothetical protein
LPPAQGPPDFAMVFSNPYFSGILLSLVALHLVELIATIFIMRSLLKFSQ